MDKLLGLMCALLCIWNTEAAVSVWAGTSPAGTLINTAAVPAGAVTISLPSSTAVGTTLFTLTATASPAIATYAFDTISDGNPATHGKITSGTSAAVTLAKAIDYPTVKQVVFKVVATDTASLAATMTVTINFGPSTDTAYSFCVADPTASGTVIGKPTSSVTTGVWTVTAGTDVAKFTIVDGSIKTAAKLESTEKVYYAATLTLTDGTTSTTTWPLHVLVDNSCLSSGVAQIVSGVAMILLTLLAYRVV